MTPRDEPDSALLERLLTEDGGEPPSQLASARDCLRFLEQVWPRPVGAKHEPIKLGRFEIVREIGRGGHGIVLLARDPEHQRDVALKLPRPEVLLSDSLRWRFEQEAQVAAKLSHPNIVPIYEVGRTEATWYIASAYCPGPNLAAWLKEHGPASPREAAAIIKGLAAAVAHAHDVGLLHRDIKPANVLMAAGNEQSAVPMLTDFGLAKVLEPEPESDNEVTIQQTQSGAILGTIKYMAPEQVQGHRQNIGVATDIYALGAVLYELLCGAPPFDDRTPLAILARIIGEDVGRPRAKRADVPLDLDSICLKCLEKEPSRRYRSAADLESDLAAFLAGEPVRARPISSPRRVARWARRRPALSVAIIASITMLLAGLFGAGVHYLRLRTLNKDLTAALDQAERQADELRWHGYVNDVRLVGQVDPSEPPEFVRDLLQRHIPHAGERDLRGFEWYVLWNRVRPGPQLRNAPTDALALAVSADGRSVFATGRDGRSTRWDLPAERPAAVARFVPMATRALVYSPDGARIASLEPGGRPGAIGVWDARTGKVIGERADSPQRLVTAAFDPTGVRLAYAATDAPGKSAKLYLWDLAAGKDVLLWDRPVGVQSIRFSPDGRLLVWIDDTRAPREVGPVALSSYDLDTRRERTTHPLGNTLHSVLALSSDGRRVATGDYEGNVTVRGLDGGNLLASHRFSEEEFVQQVEFVTGDRMLAVLLLRRKDQKKARIVVLNADDGEVLGERSVDATRLLAVAPDGRTIFAAGTRPAVEVLDVKQLLHDALRGHGPSEAWSVAFSPDGKTLISGGDDHYVRRWDVAARQELGPLDRHGSMVATVAWTADGLHWASGSFDKKVRIWDAKTGTVKHELAGHTDRVRAIAFSPDGTLLASGGRDWSVILWDVATGRRVATLEGHKTLVNALAFAPDGKLLFSGGADEIVHLWDVEARALVFTLPNDSSVRSLAVSPDNGFLAVGSHRVAQIRVWELSTRELVRELVTKSPATHALAFSPDGRTLAAGGTGRAVQFWHVKTGDELLTFDDLPHDVNGLAFSPDGRTLAAALHDGTIKLWQAPYPNR